MSGETASFQVKQACSQQHYSLQQASLHEALVNLVLSLCIVLANIEKYCNLHSNHVLWSVTST